MSDIDTECDEGERRLLERLKSLQRHHEAILNEILQGLADGDFTVKEAKILLWPHLIYAMPEFQ